MATTVLFNDFDFTTSYAPWVAQTGCTPSVVSGELQLTNTQAFVGVVWPTTTEFRAGELVTFSGKARSPSSFECDAVIWNTSNPDGWSIIDNKYAALTPASNQFSIQFTVPTPTGGTIGDVCTLQFGLLYGASDGSSCYFDDVRITKGSASTIPIFMAHYNMLSQG